MNPIEKEYITHIPKITDYINLDELYVYIDYVIDNIDIDIKDLGKEIKLNNKDKLVFVRNNSMPLDTRVGAGKVVVKDKIKQVYQFVESK